MKLSTYLVKHNIKPDDFASSIGVDRATVFRWMSGASFPRRGLIKRIREHTAGEVTLVDFDEADEQGAAVSKAEGGEVKSAA